MPFYKGFDVPTWVLDEINKKKEKEGMNSLVIPTGVSVSQITVEEERMDQWVAAKKIREILNGFDTDIYKETLSERIIATNQKLDDLEDVISGKKIQEIREAIAVVRKELLLERNFVKEVSPAMRWQRMKTLSVHLATNKTLPQTKDATTLRAIRAILKNNEGEPSGKTETEPSTEPDPPENGINYTSITTDATGDFIAVTPTNSSSNGIPF